MASSELKRRTLYFIPFAGALVVVLLGLPFIESLILAYLSSSFGLEVTPSGTVSRTGGGEVDVMMATTVELVVNAVHIVKIFLWMALVIAVVRFFGFLVLKTTTRRASPSEIATLTKTVVSIVVYIVAFFIIFQSQYPGVDLGALFTGSTIIGIVVGLALQDTLGNLFAGLALQADQPFQAGDVVNISNRGTGIVESVTWRGVKIRTFQNKLLIISNAVLGKETIEVAPRDNLNARLVYFNTLYTNSPARTAQVVREAVRLAENVSQKIRPIVRIRNLGDNGLDWEVKYWCDDYSRYNDTDALVRQRIWYAFGREGIEFAFPTRTVYMQPAAAKPDNAHYVDTVAEQIVRVPIFTPLSEDEIEKLAKASNVRLFAPGETIVRSGAEGNSMFVITHGSVKVRIPDRDTQRTINQLKVNDFFGEMSLLTGEPRSATVIADEETEVIEIRKSALRPIIEANPEIADAICQMIEKRRELLQPQTPAASADEAPEERSALRAIKNFFGLD